MDEQQYKAWWPLHLRVALGERLSDEEQRFYEAGRAELQAEERAELRQDVTELRALQAQLQALAARDQELAREEMHLREQAARLERQYLAVTGKPLGLEI
ncbi:MAG: hypothetical protein ACREEM_27370 [Blastocatellia bacterium]